MGRLPLTFVGNVFHHHVTFDVTLHGQYFNNGINIIEANKFEAQHDNEK